MLEAPLDVDALNHSNVTIMWRALGATPVGGVETKDGFMAEGWPNRLWLGFGEVLTDDDLAAIEQARGERQMLLPLWAKQTPETLALLERAGYVPALRQTAMSLPLVRTIRPPDRSPMVDIVDQTELLEPWSAAVSAAFGYTFDPEAARRLFHDQAATLFVAHAESTDGSLEISGTGVTYRTGTVGGVHWVGVVPDHRRQGIARELMASIVAHLIDSGTSIATLQSSDAGRLLYESLGFEGDTPIQTYRSPDPAQKVGNPHRRPQAGSRTHSESSHAIR